MFRRVSGGAAGGRARGAPPAVPAAPAAAPAAQEEGMPPRPAAAGAGFLQWRPHAAGGGPAFAGCLRCGRVAGSAAALGASACGLAPALRLPPRLTALVVHRDPRPAGGHAADVASLLPFWRRRLVPQAVG